MKIYCIPAKLILCFEIKEKKKWNIKIIKSNDKNLISLMKRT
jgi:hypothetical protein